MMTSFITWYILITIVGLVTFPISFRLFYALPGRAFSLARPLGLLIWGYFFWIGVSLGILPNNPGGALFPLMMISAVSFWLLRGKWVEVASWVSGNKAYIIKAEVLFLFLFAGWAIVRAANPEIVGTEKPMEMAFINAILRSTSFPPQDPWLSGYAISYYYFGYVMVACLIKISGVLPAVGFNLGLALWFSLTGLGAYGVVFELLGIKNWKAGVKKSSDSNFAYFAPAFLLIISNIEGFLEMLHSRGIFWQKGAGVGFTSRFWTWLDIQELSTPPIEPFSWIPQRISGIWWWRTSRILQDYDLAGNSKEIIDEVPIFTYLLGDLHPHVLAMPFVLLVITLCLQLYCQIPRVNVEAIGIGSWVVQYLRGKPTAITKTSPTFLVGQPVFWITALAVGGMAFLNTWDFPIYVALYSGFMILAQYQTQGWNIKLVGEFLEHGLVMGFTGILLYIPFYLGFSSQASGILPSLGFFTRGIHFWIMFAPLLVPMLAWLVMITLQNGDFYGLRKGIKFASMVIGGLWLTSYGLALGLIALGSITRFAPFINLFFGIQGVVDGTEIIGLSLVKRILQPGMLILLFIILSLCWGSFRKYRCSHPPKSANDWDIQKNAISPIQAIPNSPDAVVLLLILGGAALVLIPEFVYLRDQFGWRMNTIFKFYFQAWLLWSLAAAYGSVEIFRQKTAIKGVFIQIIWGITILAALAYPIFGIWSKTNGFKPERWTLDGSAFMADYSREEMEAINWLKEAPMGVVAEAVGGSYSNYARVSTFTGYQTVLGWPGHESQWRGGAQEMGSREGDIEKLYRSSNWEEIAAILKKYHIKYVYLGELERGKYHSNEGQFLPHLSPVFRNNSVVIFEVPQSIFLTQNKQEVPQ